MVIVGPSPFDGFYLGGFGSFQQVGNDIDGQANLVITQKNSTTTTYKLATQNGGGDTDEYRILTVSMVVGVKYL